MSRNHNNKLFLTLLMATLLFHPQEFQVLSSEAKCDDFCRRQENLEFCDRAQGCHSSACSQGCLDFRVGLASGCEAVCNFTSVIKINSTSESCLFGCQMGVEGHVDEVLTETPLRAPQLLHNSRDKSSLTLSWTQPDLDFKSLSLNPRFVLQFRFYTQKLSPESWQDYGKVNQSHHQLFPVENLEPYTEYEFRIAWNFSDHLDPIFSNPSIPIATKPGGKSSAPAIKSIENFFQFGTLHIKLTWEAPMFPRNKLTFYQLEIKELPTKTNSKGHHELLNMAKDIKITDPPLTYTTGPLDYGREFNVTLAAMNLGGVLGDVAHKLITTPDKPQLDDSAIPYLIFMNNSKLFRKSLHELELNEFEEIQSFNSTIASFDFYQNSVLVLMEDQKVHFLEEANDPELSKFHLRMWKSRNESPKLEKLSLSVDWLYKTILFTVKLEGDKYGIEKCGLENGICKLLDIQRDFEILNVTPDPARGLLYWQEENAKTEKSTIFALNWNCNNSVNVIVENLRFHHFAISYSQGNHLIVPNLDQNDLLNVTRNGGNSIIKVTHEDYGRTEKRFKDIMRIFPFTENVTFWTTKEGVNEEILMFGKKYQNILSRELIMLEKAILMHKSRHPIPAPINLVEDLAVQAYLDDNLESSLKISWKPPMHLECGGWQSWNYSIFVNESIAYMTNHLEHHAKAPPNALYSIQVQAFSESGKGPLSDAFIVKTFPKWKVDPNVDYSDLRGIHRASIILEKSRVLSDQLVQADQILTVGNDTLLISKNKNIYKLQNETLHLIYESYNRFEMVFEPFAQMIYLPHVGKGLVSRILLDQGQMKKPEILPIISTRIRNLMINSLLGQMCWVSHGTDIYCSKLHGTDEILLYRLDQFAGDQIVSSVMNNKDGNIYMLIRNSLNPVTLKICRLNPRTGLFIMDTVESHFLGSLQILDEKLFWLESKDNIVTYDIMGKSLMRKKPDDSNGITTFHVQFDSKIVDPELVIIPDKVEQSSIQLEDRGDQGFIIRWRTVSSKDGVSYMVQVNSYEKNIVNENFLILFKEDFPLNPYSKIEVSVLAMSKWAKSEITQKTLYTPEEIPSPPRNIRLFYEFSKEEENKINFDIRWDRPESPNGLLSGYRLTLSLCKQDQNTNCFQQSLRVDDANITQASLETEKKNLSKEIRIEVRALNGVGESEAGILKRARSDDNVYSVSPLVFIFHGTKIELYDLDLSRRKWEYQGIHSVCGQPIYNSADDSILFCSFANKNSQIISLNVKNLEKTRILNLHEEVHSIALDHISRLLYVVMNDKIEVQSLESRRLQQSVALMRGSKMNNLQVDPFSNSLYFMDGNQDLKRFLVKDGTFYQIPKSGEGCNCWKHILEPNKMLDFSIRPRYLDYPDILLLFSNGSVLQSDYKLCHCSEISSREVFQSGKNLPLSITQNWLKFANKEDIMGSVLPTSVISLIPKSDIYQFVPRNWVCIQPQGTNKFLEVVSKNEHSLSVLPPQVTSSSGCPYENSLPLTTMIIHALEIEDEDEDLSKKEYCQAQFCPEFLLDNVNGSVTVSGLKPYTAYGLAYRLENKYTKTATVQNGTEISTDFLTKATTLPSPPRNVTPLAISPKEVVIFWVPSEKARGQTIDYEVHYWKKNLVKDVTKNINERNWKEEETPTIIRNVTLTGLSPGTKYWIVVLARTKSNETLESSEVVITTFEELNPPVAQEIHHRNLTLSWEPPTNHLIKNHTIVCKASHGSEQFYSGPQSSHANGTYVHILKGLSPGTNYEVRANVVYKVNVENIMLYSNHSGPIKSISTPASIPPIPERPKYSTNSSQIFITWKDKDEKDEQTVTYELQTKAIDGKESSPDNGTDWVSIHNGTEKKWPFEGLDEQKYYIFKVRAKTYDWSNFSEESPPYNVGDILANKQHIRAEIGNELLIGTVVGLFILCVVIFLAYITFHRRSIKEKQLGGPLNLGPVQDLELRIIRENGIGKDMLDNPLYQVQIPSEADLELLPKIKRSQIEVTRFIGSGAFGEVYEGRATNIADSNKPMKVAIKTLRKSTVPKDKTEFLKEAQVMLYLDHENILRLIGVCLDNDPHFIITELMEGGDLISFLKNSRPITSRHPLTQMDLLEISLDVAKGCSYLEDKHFVHRDIAARNCLVSSINPQERKVKIGDFGLSRDIQKYHYYRKNENNFLPVRWMSPESLVDGVFTTQSDVWSFGVLLWEIMTLGQQPYQARSNMDVLDFIKQGGHLELPPHSPDRISKLMLCCWAYKPQERPSFAECLVVIQDLISSEGQFSSIVNISTPGNLNSTVIDSKDSLKHSLKNNHVDRGINHHGNKAMPNANSDSGMQCPSYLQLLQEQLRLSRNSSAQNSSDLNSVSTSINSFRTNGRSSQYDIPSPTIRSSITTPPPSSPSITFSAYEMPRPLDIIGQEKKCQCSDSNFNNSYENKRMPHICEA